MEDWTIIIRGKGRCHTGNHETDVDLALHRFVDELKDQKQTLNHVSFTVGESIDMLAQRESILRIAKHLEEDDARRIKNLPSRLIRVDDKEELVLDVTDGTYSFAKEIKSHKYQYEFLMSGLNTGKFDIFKQFP